jgi:hypothetical protein
MLIDWTNKILKIKNNGTKTTLGKFQYNEDKVEVININIIKRIEILFIFLNKRIKIDTTNTK